MLRTVTGYFIYICIPWRQITPEISCWEDVGQGSSHQAYWGQWREALHQQAVQDRTPAAAPLTHLLQGPLLTIEGCWLYSL